MNKRVLVTGHNGYLGSVMTPVLVDAGWDVVGLDTFYFGDCTLTPGHAAVREITKDIREVSASDLAGFDAVVHLAALSNDPIGNLNSGWTGAINENASVHLARLAKEAGTARFLFSSSCIMYGMSEAEVVDVFAGVKRLFPCTSEDRLAFAVRLPASHFEALHRASEKFTRRTLEEHGIDAGDGNVFLALRDHVAELTSLTSNGALMPRSEVDEEFNELQRVIAALFEDFGCEAVFDRGQCSVNLRFSMPPTLASLAASRHPYQSLKMHSDVWAGEPIDFVNCNIPVFLDGKAMNLELAEASPAL